MPDAMPDATAVPIAEDSEPESEPGGEQDRPDGGAEPVATLSRPASRMQVSQASDDTELEWILTGGLRRLVCLPAPAAAVLHPPGRNDIFLAGDVHQRICG